MNITAIIPSKNGAQTIGKCLQAIKMQKFDGAVEILLLDSSSTDETVDIALMYGAKIIPVQAKYFDHGLTRNEGVKHASNELIYFTVQDAWLASDDIFQIMTAHFLNSKVQSVTGMQAIPHEKDKNPALWFKRSSEPVAETFAFENKAFLKLSLQRQKEFCCWDNVNTGYRKSALTAIPFVQTNMSEDMIWAKHAHEKGWTIIRDPSVLVYHYHHQTFKYNFRVTYMVAYEDKKIFGVTPAYPSVIIPFLKRIKRILKNNNFTVIEKINWVFHNAGIYRAQLLSITIFKAAVFFGGDPLLKKSLQFFCKTMPQGKQRSAD